MACAGVSCRHPRAAEAAGPAHRGRQLIHHAVWDAQYRHDDHLANPVAWVDDERHPAVLAVPQRYSDATAVVVVNQANQIAKHDAVLVTQTGARQTEEPRLNS